LREWIGSFTPRPKRGELETCLNEAAHEGGSGIFEVFCHPGDTASLLDGGIKTVNGLPVHVEVVGQWPEADQLRITVRRGVSTPVGRKA
jgi:hypothetical protein